jgi:hypothetical protein
MKRLFVLVAIAALIELGESFSPTLAKPLTRVRAPFFLSIKSWHHDDEENVVSLLLEEVQKESQNATTLSSYIEKLEHRGGERRIDDTATDRFDPLLGLYDVSFVKTAKEGDNPVGGKWTRKSGIAQKLLSTRRSFQHILAVNETGCGKRQVQTGSGEVLEVVGEAVNVISLDALWGLFRTTVILRGDAVAVNATERASDRYCQPLSAFAVRALFDAPRIVIGKKGRFLNINVGPKTSVVLDTIYTDDKVRIGLGGRSGSRFVFTRCAGTDVEANEFRTLLARKAWSKVKTLTALVALSGLGAYGAVSARALVRVLSGSVSLISGLAAGLITLSGGGIEAGDRSVAEAQRIYGDGEPVSSAVAKSAS